MSSVAACEAAQTCWYTCRAEALGGETWTDGPLSWIREGKHQSLMFPTRIPADALRRGVERARATGMRSIGAWLGAEVDASALAAAGFERGWEPWWMTAAVADVGLADDPRIELQQETVDYTGEYADYAETLALTRIRPQRSWYAAAYAGSRKRFAGRAWSHLTASDGAGADVTVGVFDMNVWPYFRRRGLGTGLLRAVVGVAAAAAAGADDGATTAVLNATPEGKLLYESCGFRRIGTGITWWLHFAA